MGVADILKDRFLENIGRRSDINRDELPNLVSGNTKTIAIIEAMEESGIEPALGFSIKSQLGGPSTLLNAGKTTNFIFKIKDITLSQDEIDRINQISTRRKVMDRVSEVQKKGGVFEFLRTERQMFSNNLVLIDSLLPQLLSQLVLDFYSSEFSRVKDLVQKASEENPLDYENESAHKFYEYKIKRFLTDAALGMMPSKVWNGKYDATGGYLIVEDSGNILCYHIYNRNEFEDYLLNNTKLETASSEKHGFGKIYKENDVLYFHLNLQIRFTK